LTERRRIDARTRIEEKRQQVAALQNTAEMIEIVQTALELRAQGVIKF